MTVMKKTYISPETVVIEVTNEIPFLTGSISDYRSQHVETIPDGEEDEEEVGDDGYIWID